MLIYIFRTICSCSRLPDPCKDHAVVMARFARDILEKLNQLTHKLESSLGPDTGDLNMVSTILVFDIFIICSVRI